MSETCSPSTGLSTPALGPAWGHSDLVQVLAGGFREVLRSADLSGSQDRCSRQRSQLAAIARSKAQEAGQYCAVHDLELTADLESAAVQLQCSAVQAEQTTVWTTGEAGLAIASTEEATRRSTPGWGGQMPPESALAVAVATCQKCGRDQKTSKQASDLDMCGGEKEVPGVARGTASPLGSVGQRSEQAHKESDYLSPYSLPYGRGRAQSDRESIDLDLYTRTREGRQSGDMPLHEGPEEMARQDSLHQPDCREVRP